MSQGNGLFATVGLDVTDGLDDDLLIQSMDVFEKEDLVIAGATHTRQATDSALAATPALQAEIPPPPSLQSPQTSRGHDAERGEESRAVSAPHTPVQQQEVTRHAHEPSSHGFGVSGATVDNQQVPVSSQAGTKRKEVPGNSTEPSSDGGSQQDSFAEVQRRLQAQKRQRIQEEQERERQEQEQRAERQQAASQESLEVHTPSMDAHTGNMPMSQRQTHLVASNSQALTQDRLQTIPGPAGEMALQGLTYLATRQVEQWDNPVSQQSSVQQSPSFSQEMVALTQHQLGAELPSQNSEASTTTDRTQNTPKLVLAALGPAWQTMLSSVDEFVNQVSLESISARELEQMERAHSDLAPFPCTIRYVHRVGYKSKVPALAVSVKSVTTYERNAQACLQDPTGEIDATLSHSALEKYDNNIATGTVLILRNISVFSPNRRKHYLVITARNIVTAFFDDTRSKRKRSGIPRGELALSTPQIVSKQASDPTFGRKTPALLGLTASAKHSASVNRNHGNVAQHDVTVDVAHDSPLRSFPSLQNEGDGNGDEMDRDEEHLGEQEEPVAPTTTTTTTMSSVTTTHSPNNNNDGQGSASSDPMAELGESIFDEDVDF